MRRCFTDSEFVRQQDRQTTGRFLPAHQAGNTQSGFQPTPCEPSLPTCWGQDRDNRRELNVLEDAVCDYQIT